MHSLEAAIKPPLLRLFTNRPGQPTTSTDGTFNTVDTQHQRHRSSFSDIEQRKVDASVERPKRKRVFTSDTKTCDEHGDISLRGASSSSSVGQRRLCLQLFFRAKSDNAPPSSIVVSRSLSLSFCASSVCSSPHLLLSQCRVEVFGEVSSARKYHQNVHLNASAMADTESVEIEEIAGGEGGELGARRVENL